MSFSSFFRDVIWYSVVEFLVKAAVVGYLFHYCLLTLFNKDIPWYVDVLAGYAAGKKIAYVAVTCLVLRYCDVPTPLWDWITVQRFPWWGH